jgi:hypothetical protein
LQADRTRRGLPPAVALETRINLWQATSPIALDVDHDGRQDLVLGYWKGLKNHHLVLDAYLQKDDGTFGTSARTTTFEVEQADRSFLSYGHDVDGDGLADLVLLAGNRMLVYLGSAKANKGSDLVAEKARWTFPLSPAGTIHVNGVKPGDHTARQGSGSKSESKSDSDSDADSGADADSDADDQAEAGSDDFDLDSSEPSRTTTRRDGRPMFFDFDGNGAEEVFFSTETLGGGSHLLIFQFPKAAQGP